MTVNRLSLDGFRNYTCVSLDFSDDFNVITGRNAQGKTNLIEALNYLATGKSFRQASDKELINFDKENARIRADIVSRKREQMLEARFCRGRRRELYVNNSKLIKSRELVGRLSAVLFCPDDLNIIKDGASIRRKLMDSSLSQLRPGYLASLTEFNRLYEHKTRILKDHYEKQSLLELLDDYNVRLAQQSAQLIYYRSAFSIELNKRAAEIHKEFSDDQEMLNINYKTVGNSDVKNKKPSEILPELLEHQKAHYKAELRSGLCLSGAHKDDLEIEINGKAARKYASQGQARTASVSIKLAEREIHKDNCGEYPILLLDDVLSELDGTRKNFILGKIKQGQVFITCCNEDFVNETQAGNIYKIENGSVISK